jgi:hypothetical protein
MRSLLQAGFGMFSTRVGRCCPGGDEKRFLINLLSGAVTGMPPFVPPVAPVMAAELALMAALIGTLRAAFPRLPVWAVLAVVLAAGRLVNAGLLYGVARAMALPAGFVARISLLSGWPGLVLMMAVIPQVVRLSVRTRDG